MALPERQARIPALIEFFVALIGLGGLKVALGFVAVPEAWVRPLTVIVTAVFIGLPVFALYAEDLPRALRDRGHLTPTRGAGRQSSTAPSANTSRRSTSSIVTSSFRTCTPCARSLPRAREKLSGFMPRRLAIRSFS